jgi:uncharacterized protein YbcI
MTAFEGTAEAQRGGGGPAKEWRMMTTPPDSSRGETARELDEPLTGGRLLSAISNSIVSLLRDHYGRGPMKAKTYALDDMIVCVLRESGFSAVEKTMMDSGEPERVVGMREDFQRVMATRYKETIEELTNRKVVAFLSQAHVDPDITMEVFFVDRALDGFGTVEIVDAPPPEND